LPIGRFLKTKFLGGKRVILGVSPKKEPQLEKPFLSYRVALVGRGKP